MPTATENIAVLIVKHLKEELTIEEKNVLDEWIMQSEENRRLFEELTNGDSLQSKLKEYHGIASTNDEKFAVTNTRQHRVKSWLTYLAAASVIALLIGVAYPLLQKNMVQPIRSMGKAQAPFAWLSDTLAAVDKTTLTLGDGSIILPDDSPNGILNSQGNTTVIKQGEQLLYYKQPDFTITPGEPFNTVTTPSGGQYQLQLPDGSNVWLNASSTIRYPVAFTGKERRVELIGEAYFEIAKDLRKPFKVSFLSSPDSMQKQAGTIEVLGTHFNISAYRNAGAIKTTLIEGKVACSIPGTRPAILSKPGQQAQIFTASAAGDSIHIKEISLDNAIDWKSGYFHFNSTDIKSIMRTLARWYDVEVKFKDHVTGNIVGDAPLNAPLSTVLEMLEYTAVAHFQIKGKTVFVTKSEDRKEPNTNQ
jgi:ferric-dicitrate binding protein FerR (iron transport regulator)